MDTILLGKLIAHLLLPPGGVFALFALSIVLYRRRPRLARTGMLLALLVGYAVSTPLAAGLLMGQLQRYPAIRDDDVRLHDAFAIVVLGAGRRDLAPEYGGETVSASSLERLRYGAWLQRRTGLPVLVSGGRVRGAVQAEAELMARVLTEMGASATWLETKSRNTRQNAEFASRILLSAQGALESADAALGPAGKPGPIVLVTHAYHMDRSVRAFKRNGLEIIPAPTAFYQTEKGHQLHHYVPQAPALEASYRALWELLGTLWYRLA